MIIVDAFERTRSKIIAAITQLSTTLSVFLNNIQFLVYNTRDRYRYGVEQNELTTGGGDVL
jgi:hypothetical protein